MPDIQKEIRDWLHAQPECLQLAAEILLYSGGASDRDIETLVERLKKPEGQQVTTHGTFAKLARS